MSELQLIAGAIEHLKALAKRTGGVTPDTPDMQPLWDNRFIMGNHARTHITAQGKKFILQLMQAQDTE
jgi:hypothetical protein